MTESSLTEQTHATRAVHPGEVLDSTPEEHITRTRIGTTCECGNATPQESQGVLRESDLHGTVRALYAGLRELYREGQHSQRVEFLALVESLHGQWERGMELDFALALGQAVHEEGDSDEC